ncbi:hypothetical protein C2S51_018028 [Perilla frutescens var. frutescens]|nr:hypothetical protein C2S51_018028 [Perilla frutescens var. frutescens]
MEIQAWLFITFWAVISITFLHLGFRALEKTELSESVSPLVMFLFKHSLAISSCFSSSYALKFRSQSRYAVRSNYVLLVYVFFSVVFPRTIEGILIWHVVKAIFAWLLYFLSKLKIFLGMIFRVPASLLLSFFRFLWKILPVIGVIIVALVVYYVPKSTILSIIYSVGGIIFASSVGVLFQIIYSYAVIWFFSSTEFLWVPIMYFLGICIAIVFSVGFLWLLCVSTYKFLLFCKNNFSELKTRAGILLVLELSLFFISAKKRNFSPILALSISHFICVFWAELSTFGDYTLVSDGEGFDGLVQIAAKIVTVKMKKVLSMLKEHRAKKFIEFAVGTVGAVLFQNFFRITSFSEVAAFLYLAVMWLANLVLLGFSGDFGVFNFLLANVVVGCTVGQFGLHSVTWLALGAAFLLYGLRLKLESLTVAYEEGQQIQLSFLGNNEPIAQLQHIVQPSHLPV